MLHRTVLQKLQNESQSINSLSKHGAFYKTRFRLDQEQHDIQRLTNAISDRITKRIDKNQAELNARVAELTALSPTLSLKRGFILMRSMDDIPMNTRTALLDAQKAIVSFTDGDVNITVDQEAMK